MKTTLKAKDEVYGIAVLTDLGAQVTHTDGVAPKVFLIDCSKLGDSESRRISQFKELRSLTFYGSYKGLTDETLPHLSGLTKFEELDADGIQVSNAGLVKLTALTSFRFLSFFQPSFGKKSFDGSDFAALAIGYRLNPDIDESVPRLLILANSHFDLENLIHTEGVPAC